MKDHLIAQQSNVADPFAAMAAAKSIAGQANNGNLARNTPMRASARSAPAVDPFAAVGLERDCECLVHSPTVAMVGAAPRRLIWPRRGIALARVTLRLAGSVFIAVVRCCGPALPARGATPWWAGPQPVGLCGSCIFCSSFRASLHPRMGQGRGAGGIEETNSDELFLFLHSACPQLRDWIFPRGGGVDVLRFRIPKQLGQISPCWQRNGKPATGRRNRTKARSQRALRRPGDGSHSRAPPNRPNARPARGEVSRARWSANY